jgi:hypothetical protein
VNLYFIYKKSDIIGGIIQFLIYMVLITFKKELKKQRKHLIQALNYEYPKNL